MALLRGLAAILRSIVDQGDNGLIRKTSATAVDIVETTDDIQFGKVGIGVAPLYPLHIQVGAGSGATPAAASDDVVVDLAATGGMSILSGDGNNVNIQLGTAADSSSATLQWDSGNSRVNFGSYLTGAEVRIRSGNGVNAMTIASDQRVSIGTTATAAQFRVQQASSSGAIPVAYLQQSDIDEAIATFRGTSTAANLDRTLVAAGDVTTPTLVGYCMVAIVDDAAIITNAQYFVPFYSIV